MVRGKVDYYVGDFETTVYEGQEYTAVWASALVKLGSEEVEIYGCIEDTFERLKNLADVHNIVVYYHNLKFDGEFWISHLLQRGMKDCYVEKIGDFLSDYDIPPGSFKYSISDRGQWYEVTIRLEHTFIILRDSLKLLPFSVEKIGKSFGTKHKKLDMCYEGYRYPNCPITDEEKRYISNDVLVVKEALEIMFAQGHNRLTIGSCCLAEFKAHFQDRKEYDSIFPNLYKIPLENKYGASNVGEYIVKSYGGGWCYLYPGKANRTLKNGLTADVNSLYPSMMHSESGNKYPICKPKFFIGSIPDKALENFYFVRFITRFYLKEGKLPFIHKRFDKRYRANENLETSDILGKDGKYYSIYKKGEETVLVEMELTLSKPEHELFLECYHVVGYRELDGCYFQQEEGLFDSYLDKYKEIKLRSTGAIRESAKLFSNNLYGKMASSPDSSFKTVYLNEDGAIAFHSHDQASKIPGYIAAGSAITAYSRRFTITAAIKNFHGPNAGGFVYADTDSIHCDDYTEADLIDVPTHDTHYNHWKIESHWQEGRFARQKTYLEVINGEPKITCAGMPQRCKDVFARSLSKNIDVSDLSESKAKDILKYKDYILQGHNLEDFKKGLVVPGKLFPKHIKGGVLLTEGEYRIV